MKKRISTVIDGAEEFQNNPLQIKDTGERKEIDFYLSGEITEIENYIDFLRAVGNCRSGDLVTIHINCYGGLADTAWNIYDELRSSNADVVVSIEGACCSAATMIMLGANAWEVSKHAYCMVHCWTDCGYGKWNELVAKYDFDKKVAVRHFKELYKNFMTDKEIEECLGGKDFYFDNEETMERLNNYQKDEIERMESIQKITSKYSSMAQKEIDKSLNGTTSKKRRRKA